MSLFVAAEEESGGFVENIVELVETVIGCWLANVVVEALFVVSIGFGESAGFVVR